MTLENRIKQAIELIKKQPLNHNLRIELLQLYCLNGQWEAALKLIQQYIKLNPKDAQTKGLFLGNIECELYRENVFKGLTQAQAYPDQDLNVLNRQQKILDLFLQNQPEQLSSAFLEQCENSSEFKLINNEQQQIDGQFIDTDCRLAFVLEIFDQNQYYWLDINSVQTLRFKATEYTTDLIWRRGEVVLKDQRHIACFFPVRYPLLDAQKLNDQMKYSALTDWESFGELTIGLGQKTYFNGDIDVSILDIESLTAL